MSTSDQIVSTLGPEPWKAPWWKTTRGDGATLVWILLIHVTAVTGLILFPIPHWPIAVGAAALAWLGGMGTTVCYHRTLAHRALRLNFIPRHVLIFFAMFNGSGSPDSWTANHRQHHAKVETPEDISSPRIGGFWWSHLKWLWQAGSIPMSRWCPDLSVAQYRFWHRMQVPMLALSFFGGLMIGWEAFFWLGAIRLVLSLHGQCFVNSICHMKPGVGPGEDSSQNVIWLGLFQFLQGENWHGNHHAKPISARLGWRAWQVDSGWYLIWVLERFRLATNVKRPDYGGPAVRAEAPSLPVSAAA